MYFVSLLQLGDLCSLGPQVQKLQAILKPMMLRRLKEDVEKNLAPKQETIIEVSLCEMHIYPELGVVSGHLKDSMISRLTARLS